MSPNDEGQNAPGDALSEAEAGRDHMAPGDEAPPGAATSGENACRVCGGSGRVDGAECENCQGTGKVTEGLSAGA